MRTIQEFVDGLNERYPKVKDWDVQYNFTVGKRYYKVYTHIEGKSRSVYGFVDIATGDLYRAASWSAPAIHIRGNIKEPDVYEKSCTKYGVIYLK